MTIQVHHFFLKLLFVQFETSDIYILSNSTSIVSQCVIRRPIVELQRSSAAAHCIGLLDTKHMGA